MIKIKKLAVVAACVLAGTLALVGCSQDVELDNGDTQDKDYPVVEAPKPLPLVVGYDKLTLHGKYRQYKVDTSKGDSLTEYSDGNTGKYPIPEGAIKNGVEYPTFWSRLPLSIQPNNTDQTKGLYSIHSKGTSAIFPKSLNGDTSREKDANVRQATAGVYIALSTTSPKIQFRYRYIMKTAAGTRAFSGIDIYQVTDGAPVFKQNLRGTAEEGIFEYETGASDTAAADLIVMLPTYNGFEVKEDDADNPSGLTLVFEEGSETYEFEPFSESTQKPILIYGTSITQGDGASGLRPGAAYAAQIMWATGREVINLGVAGSAQMEYKMADFLSNIESSVFIMDPGWNLTSGAVSDTYCTANGSPADISNKEIIARAKYMVTTYRAKHPNTPIIMCPQYLKSGDAKTKEWQTAWTDITRPEAFTNTEGYYYGRPGLLLYTAYLELKAEGVKNLYWAEQGLTDANASTTYLSAGAPNNTTNLHPPMMGMTDIASWILKCMKENNVGVEVKATLPLADLTE
ncbi:MAG: hypothetical protein IKW26_07180 [Treponema sp.]|nr:hypothetical protein [Treponema sp.]